MRTAAVLILGQPSYLRPEIADSIRHVSLFCSTKTRVAVNEGWADFMPCFFSQVPSLLGEHIPADVAMVSVSPPDEHGYCSLGVSVDYSRRAVEVCRTVIAEVNPTHAPTARRLPGACAGHRLPGGGRPAHPRGAAHPADRTQSAKQARMRPS